MTYLVLALIVINSLWLFIIHRLLERLDVRSSNNFSLLGLFNKRMLSMERTFQSKLDHGNSILAQSHVAFHALARELTDKGSLFEALHKATVNDALDGAAFRGAALAIKAIDERKKKTEGALLPPVQLKKRKK